MKHSVEPPTPIPQLFNCKFRRHAKPRHDRIKLMNLRQQDSPATIPLPIVASDDSAADAACALGPEVDLETVLAAWHTATLRLERTHETLCGEVARLTKELEIKNRELARKNRLADLGQMAAHIAHEVRNNLVPVSLYMSLLRRRLSDDSGSQDILAKIEAGFTALDATVNDLLNFTAHRQPQWQTFMVGDVVNEVCESLEPQLEAQMIDVDIDVPPNTLLTADRELFRRALVNLVLNAIDAMPEGGSLVITSYDSARFRAGSCRQRPGTIRRSQAPRVRTVLQHEADRHWFGVGVRAACG